MLKFDLRCEICQSKFDSNYYIPKMLQCGHTLCLKCANRMKINNIDRCPYDRKQVDFDDDKLSNNIYILSLIEGSIKKENISGKLIEEAQILEFNAKPVINTPGWKNTLDGFISDNHMFSAESNGFMYCTNLDTGEWWYLYLNQFFGKFFFLAENKNMYLIDNYGNLFQIFRKNYYLQIWKKSNWKESQLVAVLRNCLYSIEPNNKIYETNLENGKFEEIIINYKNEAKSFIDDHNYSLNSVFKNLTFFISNKINLLLGNKNGEIYSLSPNSGKLILIKDDFSKNLDIYVSDKNFLYFIEKNSKLVKRMFIGEVLNYEMGTKINYESDNIFNLQSKFLNIEVLLQILPELIPIKLLCDEEKIAIIDKSGELFVYHFKTLIPKNLKCKFMLRNCHLQNSSIMEDGNLIILDSIRLSLNKLNILNGTEAVILHSQKFLYNIKYVFNCNSKIYFIDTSGTLHLFTENDKKITQIGYPSICKYINDFVIHKNNLYTIEGTSIFKTNLTDGVYVEYKLKIKEYDYFLADNTQILIINGEEVNILNPNDYCSVKTKFKIEKFGPHLACFTLFKNYLVYYNKELRTIEGINLEDFSFKIFVSDFPNVSFFINNSKLLLAILRDGVIYTLYY